MLESIWAQGDRCPPWCMLRMLCCYLGRPPDSIPFCMHSFCQALGLTFSPLQDRSCGLQWHSSWHVACWAAAHVLPQPASFKYLVFHGSGSMRQLLQNGKGAAALFGTKDKALMCGKSFPMIRCLFDAVVKPTVLYGCEVWALACPLALGPELKDKLGVQMAFFRQL